MPDLGITAHDLAVSERAFGANLNGVVADLPRQRLRSLPY